MQSRRDSDEAGGTAESMAAPRTTTPDRRRPRRARGRNRLLGPVIAVLAVAAGSAVSAGAARQDAGVTISDSDRTVHVVLDGSRATVSVDVGTPPVWALECYVDTGTYQNVWTIFHSGVPVQAEDLRGLPEEQLTEEWAYLRCPPNEHTMAINPLIEFSHMLSMWPVGESPPAEVVDVVVQQAIGSLEVPATAGVSAPFGDEQAPMITQLDTWLWIDGTVWQARTAAAGPVFGITATATATPTHVEWSTLEQTVDCGANTGAIYDFTRPDDTQRSDCTVVYRHSSVVEDATLTAAITWRITYGCNVPCGSGVYGDLVVVTERPVRVAELLAVGTSSAPPRTEGPRG